MGLYLVENQNVVAEVIRDAASIVAARPGEPPVVRARRAPRRVNRAGGHK